MFHASLVWLQFGICATLILIAGTQLSRYGDVIADKAGLSRSWVGLILLATVSSLPELVTGMSSVTLADAPDIAVGDVLGSCVFNLGILVVLDFFMPDESIYTRASQGHILSAGFGILMIGFAAFCVLIGRQFPGVGIGHVGFYTPFIVLLYFIAVRSVFFYEKKKVQEFIEAREDRFPEMTLKQAITRYVAASIVVVGAGIWLPFVGKQIAVLMGWDNTFVGTFFIAAATSMPELAITIGALRLGAVDMAVANLLGSNLFNIFMLSIDDLFYTKGSLLSHVSPNHAISAISAMMMTGIVIIGLLYRSNSRFFKLVDWVSLALFLLYVLNFTMVYLHG